MLARLSSDESWSADLVAGLPVRWEGRLLKRWQKLRKPRSGHWRAEEKARFEANTFLRKAVSVLSAVRIPLDASDATICEAGQELAKRCVSLAMLHHTIAAVYDAAVRVCDGQGVKSPRPRHKLRNAAEIEEFQRCAVARMTCPLWWRRKLREHQGQSVEKAAQALGYVHKNAEIYCSNETVYRRQQQQARNAAMLESTTAINELGHEYTLAELAAKGTANKSIRRGELMTRIAGFERIAIDCGHQGLFITSTCPSHMHQWRTLKGGKTEQNPRYDGHSTPATSQRYQAKLWSQIRAKFGRMGIKVYGFRVAEPNHDGTPHWHYLLFTEAKNVAPVQAVFWKWAMKDSPDEKGAAAHRLDIKLMQASKGTAAGYIAKYIAKNIDGYAVGQDLYGNDAIESSQRVEAWAATWRIRQFQQIGGAPVGVWRELRRVETLPAGAPDHLVQAHRAVNKVAVIEGRDNASVAWDRYCHAQGGVFVGRGYRIQLDMQPQEGLTRYGEEKPKKPAGVCTTGIERVTPHWMRHMPGAVGCFERHVYWEVASKRHQWEIKRASVGIQSAHRAPWTCVNNCTEGGKSERSEQGRSGRKSMGQGSNARQSDGGGIHGASFGGPAGFGR